MNIYFFLFLFLFLSFFFNRKFIPQPLRPTTQEINDFKGFMRLYAMLLADVTQRRSMSGDSTLKTLSQIDVISAYVFVLKCIDEIISLSLFQYAVIPVVVLHLCDQANYSYKPLLSLSSQQILTQRRLNTQWIRNYPDLWTLSL